MMIDGSKDDRKPLSDLVTERLAHSRYDSIFLSWEKAIGRLDSDRDGAVTAARAMLEAACKTVLNELGVKHDDVWDLPKLYHETAANLKDRSYAKYRPALQIGFWCEPDNCHPRGRDAEQIGDAHR